MNSGNVGIGTPTPSENLHIFGNGNNFLKIESTIDTQGAGILLKGGTSSTTWEIATQQNYASNALVFSTTPLNSANNKMSILPNGNVGIGTEGPQTKLDVAGGIRPGSATVGTACAPEGALSYDTVLHAPLFCSNSMQWATLGGLTQPWVCICGFTGIHIINPANRFDMFSTNQTGVGCGGPDATGCPGYSYECEKVQ